MAKVSVIVPCYNQAQYLPEALQSVLDQSFSDWECIIVNDGSPDNTEAVAHEWCDKDCRFKYLKKENGGLSSARNAGISMAEGEWILPLDADDKIGKEYISLALDAIKYSPDIGIIYADAFLFGEKDGKWNLPKYNYRDILKLNMIYCSAFYKKEDWIITGGYDINLIHGWEDWEFWVHLLSTTQKKVLKLPYIGFYYRIKENSMIEFLKKDNNKQQEINVYVQKKHLDIYIKEFGTYQEILSVNDWLISCNNALSHKVYRYENFIPIKILKVLQSSCKRIFDKKWFQ